MEKTIAKKLLSIQQKLHVEKSRGTSAIRYTYRSASDIIEKVKPLLEENGCVLLMNDTLESVNGSTYIKATAAIIDIDTMEKIEVNGYAREAQSLAGMSAGQITGATSSYARKYALGALLAIDDTKDLDGIADDQASGKLPIDNTQSSTPSKEDISAFIAKINESKTSSEFNAVWKSRPDLQKCQETIDAAKVVCNKVRGK